MEKSCDLCPRTQFLQHLGYGPKVADLAFCTNSGFKWNCINLYLRLFLLKWPRPSWEPHKEAKIVRWCGCKSERRVHMHTCGRASCYFLSPCILIYRAQTLSTDFHTVPNNQTSFIVWICSRSKCTCRGEVPVLEWSAYISGWSPFSWGVNKREF